MSTLLTSAGQDLCSRLSEPAFEPADAPLLVISVFNGIGGAFRGYDLAGVRPSGLISIECDKAARRVTRKAWPHAEEVANVLEVDRKMVEGWSNRYPRVEQVHIVGGFPCVHLSSVRADRENLQGEGSRLFWNLVDIIRWTRECFRGTAEVSFIVENVRSMDVAARDEISRVLGVEPLALCPSDILPYNRPRLAWVSGKVEETVGVDLLEQEGYTLVVMHGSAPPVETWLTPGWSLCRPDVPFATFMKAIRRWKPPPTPAGISRCDRPTIQRWQSDEYRFPPYQYRMENLVRSPDGALRYLSAGERERLLGFGPDHTLFAIAANSVKGQEVAFEDKRLSLCGDSFCMLSFGWLIAQLCRAWVEPLSPQQIINRFGLASGCGLAAMVPAPLAQQPGYGGLPNALHTSSRLVGHLSRHVNHTGSDVSVALGIPFTTKSGNHASIRAKWWDWRILFTSRWKFESHINYLEMRVILQAIKWRGRRASAIGSRWLHLADSMVCNYILSKGRTSSQLLQPLTREIAAHLLALNSVQLQGHVDSIENPTDAASRAETY